MRRGFAFRRFPELRDGENAEGNQYTADDQPAHCQAEDTPLAFSPYSSQSDNGQDETGKDQEDIDTSDNYSHNPPGLFIRCDVGLIQDDQTEKADQERNQRSEQTELCSLAVERRLFPAS